MKKTIDAGIGGRSFTMDEDAHARLENYLDTFTSKLDESQKKEVMDEIEDRIGELFALETAPGQVVALPLVEKVIAQLGMPDGSSLNNENNSNNKFNDGGDTMEEMPRKLYRNPEDKKIAGVCSGLATYFDIDVVLVRVLMIIFFFCGSAGFWFYIAMWIAAPEAKTPAQKCEMHRMAVTAENMEKFTKKK